MILSLDLMVLGATTVVYTVFMIFMGIKTATTYLEVKDKIFLYAGWSFIGLGLPWSGGAINFIGVLFFDQILSIRMYLLFTGANIPVSHCIFILFIMRLYDLNPKTKKVIASIYIILWIIFEILYVTLTFTNTELVGTYVNEFQIDFGSYAELMFLLSTIFAAIFYAMIGIHYWRAEDKKIHTQGKLIFTSALLFLLLACLEIFVPVIPIIILARILGMIFAVLFYAGFIMPKWVEKIFLKE